MHNSAKNQFSVPVLIRLLLASMMVSNANAAEFSNGFDLSNSTLPVTEILHGGPPRDGIPAISKPTMISAASADYLNPEDRIVGITRQGQSRAYPIRILNWHEIVNDEIDGERFAITYCPLCGTAKIDGEVTDFGVSGLLYNSDVLLYDRSTESLWSQIMNRAIAGPRVGTQLTALPITHTSWRDWSTKHPETRVMSVDTGYNRDYNRNPYAGYEKSRATYFEVSHTAPSNYHPKEIVAGLKSGEVFKAYPLIELDQQGKANFSDTLDNQQYDFVWDSANRSLSISDSNGHPIASLQGFWFAWFAFHPETLVFKADRG